MKSAIITTIIFSFAPFVQAKIISVPEMKTSISEALVVAANGDTILLAQGTHTQPELIKINKSVLIASSLISSGEQTDIEKTRIAAPQIRWRNGLNYLQKTSVSMASDLSAMKNIPCT